MIYNNNALNLFKEKYAKDLIISVFGDEAEIYAEDFDFTDIMISKYTDTIFNNLDLITNKTIIDIGSNSGIWPVLMCLNGATNVICIEPRDQFVNGINNFAKKHNLPITCVHGVHTDICNLPTVDTIFMMGVDDIIVDIVSFLFLLRTKSTHLVLKTVNRDEEIDENTIKVKLDHNFYHRGGFSLNAQKTKNSIGYETDIDKFINNPKTGRYMKFLYGKHFFETVFDYLEYDIIRYTENKNIINDHKYKIYSIKFNK